MFMNGIEGLALYSNLCHHCGHSPLCLFKFKKFYSLFKLCRIFRRVDFSGVRYLAFDTADSVGYFFGRAFGKCSIFKGFERLNFCDPFACLTTAFCVFRHKFGKSRAVGFGMVGTNAGPLETYRTAQLTV